MNPPFSLQPLSTVGQQAVQLSAARPVSIQRLLLNETVEPHDHEFTELVLIEAGSVRHDSQHGSQTLRAGDFLVIPPGPVHAYSQSRDCRLVNIYYLAEWFLWDLNLLWQNEGLMPLFFAAHVFHRPEESRIFQFSLCEAARSACERELSDIENEYRNARPSLFYTRGAFSKLLVILAGAWREQTPHGTTLDFRPEVWSALGAIDALIKEGGAFRVEQFARRVGLTANSFTRIFGAATGLTPSDYFQKRRAQHAAHLLLSSGLTVGEIAHRLGYADNAHLTRHFLKTQGLGPRAFRRRFGLNAVD